MQVVRTGIWVLLTAAVVGFVSMNWRDPSEVRLLPGTAYIFDWPVGFIALVFFLLGLVPMYAYHRAARWHLRRRVAALEAAARVPVAVAPVINPPPAEPAPEPTPEPAPTPSADLPPPESADQPTEQEPPTP